MDETKSTLRTTARADQQQNRQPTLDNRVGWNTDPRTNRWYLELEGGEQVNEPEETYHEEDNGELSLIPIQAINREAYETAVRNGDVESFRRLHDYETLLLDISRRIIRKLQDNVKNLLKLMKHLMPHETLAKMPLVYATDSVAVHPAALVVIADHSMHLPDSIYRRGYRYLCIDKPGRYTKYLWSFIRDLNNSQRKATFKVLEIKPDLSARYLAPEDEAYCNLDDALLHKTTQPRFHDPPDTLSPSSVTRNQVATSGFSPRTISYQQPITNVLALQHAAPQSEEQQLTAMLHSLKITMEEIPEGTDKPVQTETDQTSAQLWDSLDGSAQSFIREQEMKKAKARKKRTDRKRFEEKLLEKAKGRPFIPTTSTEAAADQTSVVTSTGTATSNTTTTDEGRAHRSQDFFHPKGDSPLRQQMQFLSKLASKDGPQHTASSHRLSQQQNSTDLLALRYSDEETGERKEVLQARQRHERSRQRQMAGYESTDTDQDVVVGRLTASNQPHIMPGTAPGPPQENEEILQQRKWPVYYVYEGSQTWNIPQYEIRFLRVDMDIPREIYLDNCNRTLQLVEDPKLLYRLKAMERKRFEEACKKNSDLLQVQLHRTHSSLDAMVNPPDPLEKLAATRNPKPKLKRGSSGEDFTAATPQKKKTEEEKLTGTKPKAPRKPKQNKQASTDATSVHAAKPANTAENPPKKKRGRPPKKPQEPQATASVASVGPGRDRRDGLPATPNASDSDCSEYYATTDYSSDVSDIVMPRPQQTFQAQEQVYGTMMMQEEQQAYGYQPDYGYHQQTYQPFPDQQAFQPPPEHYWLGQQQYPPVQFQDFH
jgi:hypothetical protein